MAGGSQLISSHVKISQLVGLEIQGRGFNSQPEALELHFSQLVPVGSSKKQSIYVRNRQGCIQGVWDAGIPVWAPKLGAQKFINE